LLSNDERYQDGLGEEKEKKQLTTPEAPKIRATAGLSDMLEFAQYLIRVDELTLAVQSSS
jgi:hypothetical protein